METAEKVWLTVFVLFILSAIAMISYGYFVIEPKLDEIIAGCYTE